MKKLNYYIHKGICEKEIFNYFISTLRPSIQVWDYFINWDKVNLKHHSVMFELNILNSLIESDNIEKDFIKLIKKHPEIIKVFPLLLAVREDKLKILKNYKSKDLSYLNFDFKKEKYRETMEIEARKYLEFIKSSHLINLFNEKKIKNFQDYLLGIEVGLNANGRKNRGGKLMESIVEVFISEHCQKNSNLSYLSQATPKKIKKEWEINVNYEKSAKSFDFAIYNKLKNQLFLVETNFYNGGGSKLKSVCGEFKILFNELKKQNIQFIWITDGWGWKTTKRPLEETFNNTDFILNLNMLKNEILNEIIQ